MGTDIIDKVGDGFEKIIKKAELPLFAAGFVFGSTEDIASTGAYNGADMAANLEMRLSDSIAHVTGMKVSINGQKSSASFKFNPTGFLNKGLVAAAGAAIYKEMGLPYAKEIAEVVIPFGSGYSIGGFFDPLERGTQGSRTVSGYNSGAMAGTNYVNTVVAHNRAAVAGA